MARAHNESLLALLIQPHAPDAAPFLAAIARDREFPVELHSIGRLSTAIARIDGGGVDVVVLDVSSCKAPEDGMDSVLQLLREAPRTPTVVVCSAENEGLALRAMRAGAADYILRERIASGLSRVLHSAVDLSRSAVAAAALKSPAGRARGDVIAFLGVKGGVGTTTVALNIAALLASRGTVILAEMRPAFGSLVSHLQPHGLTKNLSHCLNPGPGPTDSTDAGAALWAYKSVPGLSVLFGPQTVAQCAEIEPERAKFIVQSLSGLADHVIVDLPASLSEANRAVIEQSDSMALLVEGDPVCLRLAGPVAKAIESWNATQYPVGAVVVNRASVSCPMPRSDVDSLLQRHVLGVIPPAADLCLRAQTAGAPLVALHPESLIAASLNDLSEGLAPARRAVAGRGLGSDRFQP